MPIFSHGLPLRWGYSPCRTGTIARGMTGFCAQGGAVRISIVPGGLGTCGRPRQARATGRETKRQPESRDCPQGDAPQSISSSFERQSAKYSIKSSAHFITSLRPRNRIRWVLNFGPSQPSIAEFAFRRCGPTALPVRERANGTMLCDQVYICGGGSVRFPPA